MNEQIRSILAQETTKTSKIRQLYLLGVPRAEIARMVTNGNYGFVVNALRRMSECECGPNIQPLAAAPDYTFNRKFGIEIEAYNCSRERLARELRESGIEVVVEGYNHTTRPHWKLVTDSSLNGNDTFELVSPILVGEAGLRELEKVCWVLELCDVKVNGSCGLHVHIDAAGFSMETWRNLALSYKHLEPVIDRFMPASRRDNYYCRGLGHVSDGMIRSARTVDELKGRIGDRLSAQRSLFEGLLFRCPFGANKCKLFVYHRFAKVIRSLFGKNRNAFRRRSSGGKKVGRAYFQLPKRELPPF